MAPVRSKPDPVLGAATSVGDEVAVLDTSEEETTSGAVDVVDKDELVDEEADEEELSVDEAVEDVEVLEDLDDAEDLDDVETLDVLENDRVPVDGLIEVGSDSELADSVRPTEALVTVRRSSVPVAEVRTEVARLESVPHPYWNIPSPKLFL